MPKKRRDLLVVFTYMGLIEFNLQSVYTLHISLAVKKSVRGQLKVG